MDDRAVTTPNGTAHATLPSRRSTSISQLGNFYISYLETKKPSADINRFSSADHWIIESNFKCVHISDQWGANLKLQNGIIEPTIYMRCAGLICLHCAFSNLKSGSGIIEQTM